MIRYGSLERRGSSLVVKEKNTNKKKNIRQSEGCFLLRGNKVMFKSTEGQLLSEASSILAGANCTYHEVKGKPIKLTIAIEEV